MIARLVLVISLSACAVPVVKSEPDREAPPSDTADTVADTTPDTALDTGRDTAGGPDTAVEEPDCYAGRVQCIVSIESVSAADGGVSRHQQWGLGLWGVVLSIFELDPEDGRITSRIEYEHFCDASGEMVGSRATVDDGDSSVEVDYAYTRDRFERFIGGTVDGGSPWSAAYDGNSNRVAQADWSSAGPATFTWSDDGVLQRADGAAGWWMEYEVVSNRIEAVQVFAADGQLSETRTHSHSGACNPAFLLLPFGYPTL